MNMRALKKEWKKYRKDCKKNGVEFLSLDEFVEKVLAEQNDVVKESNEDNSEMNETSPTSSNDGEEIDEDDIIEIPDLIPVKLVTRCTCKESCPCHEIGETCSCEEECECVKETVNENMPDKHSHQLTFEESENYEEYLESLPLDVKYSELEPDLWKTIIHTDTFKKAECYDIQTAERQTQEVLLTYKQLFVKKTAKKKAKKSTKKVRGSAKTAKIKTDVEISTTEIKESKKTTKKVVKPATKKTTTKKVVKPATKKTTTKKVVKPATKK